MNRSRTAGLVTRAYAAMFGVPAVRVAIFLAKKGRLPSLWACSTCMPVPGPPGSLMIV